MLPSLIGTLAISSIIDCDVARLEGKFLAVCHTSEEAPRLMFPLPLCYRGQVPLSFVLKIMPNDKVSTIRTVPQQLGNAIVEITFKPMRANDRVDVEWKSSVATQALETFRTPSSAPIPASYPEDVRPWLKSSVSVDWEHPEVSAFAQSMRDADAIKTIYKVMRACGEMQSRATGLAKDCLASTTLKLKGSCTNNANLMAALLRANNVPARILAGYPTQFDLPFQTHYIVEAYVNGFGWLPLEPTMLTTGVTCSSMPIVSIVTIENENRRGERINVGLGVPYLSLNECTAGLVTFGTFSKTGSDHRARLDRGSKVISSLDWQNYKTNWNSWMKGAETSWRDLPAPSLK